MKSPFDPFVGTGSGGGLDALVDLLECVPSAVGVRFAGVLNDSRRRLFSSAEQPQSIVPQHPFEEYVVGLLHLENR